MLANVFVDWVFGVVFTVFGVRSHPCSCLLAVDGQVLGTRVLGGVSRPFSQHSLACVMLTDCYNAASWMS